MRLVRCGKLLANREAKIAGKLLANREAKIAGKSSIVASEITAKYSKYRRLNRKKSRSFLQRCKGKCVLEPSNSKCVPEPSNSKCVPEPSKDNADQMDVDQATTINFQEEIAVEFLSRLPVQSLHQFKCVSNFWNTLISDPYFKRMHLERAKSDRNFQKFLISKWEGSDSCYCCPLSSDQSMKEAKKLVRPFSSKVLFKIHCCSDGLVIASAADFDNEVRPVLLLWNPSTNEYVVLPSIELQRYIVDLFGLSYDATSNDYKILRISPKGRHCEILTLKGGSWRKINKHPHVTYNLLDHMDALAFVHGAFHWIGKSKTFSLVSFSISNEVYGEIPLPDEVSCCMSKVHGVSVLDGMLCVYSQAYGNFKSWVMKDYGVKDTWNVLFTMNDPSTVVVVPKYRFLDGEVLFGCIRNGGYAFRTPSGPFKHWPQGALQYGLAYTESLISPKLLIC